MLQRLCSVLHPHVHRGPNPSAVRLLFPYENMQNSNSDCNWKIKEMEGGHWVWLILLSPSDFNERWRKGDVEGFFTGSACLFNWELGLRSLNHGLPLHCKAVMHTLSDCVAGTVLTSGSCLTVWVVRRLTPCLLVDWLSDEPGWLTERSKSGKRMLKITCLWS